MRLDPQTTQLLAVTLIFGLFAVAVAPYAPLGRVHDLGFGWVFVGSSVVKLAGIIGAHSAVRWNRGSTGTVRCGRRKYPPAYGLNDDRRQGPERWHHQLLFPVFRSERAETVLGRDKHTPID